MDDTVQRVGNLQVSLPAFARMSLGGRLHSVSRIDANSSHPSAPKKPDFLRRRLGCCPRLA